MNIFYKYFYKILVNNFWAFIFQLENGSFNNFLNDNYLAIFGHTLNSLTVLYYELIIYIYIYSRFKPYGLCFAVIPTCLATPKLTHFINSGMSPASNYEKYPFSNLNESLSTSKSKRTSNFKTSILNNKNEPVVTSLLVCQITSFEEAKIFKFVSHRADMILNFDFCIQNGNFTFIRCVRLLLTKFIMKFLRKVWYFFVDSKPKPVQAESWFVSTGSQGFWQVNAATKREKNWRWNVQSCHHQVRHIFKQFDQYGSAEHHRK